MKKKCNVVMLATEKEGVIMSDVGAYGTDMVLISELDKEFRTHDRPHNHLYITSDDEIKEGDFYITDAGVFESHGFDTIRELSNFKKVIASTDSELKIKNYLFDDLKEGRYFDMQSLPEIPMDFIKGYVSNPVDEVMVRIIKHMPFDGIVPYEMSSNESENTVTTVFITPVEDKMFSQKELQELKADIQHICSWYQGGEVDRCERIENWINENL